MKECIIRKSWVRKREREGAEKRGQRLEVGKQRLLGRLGETEEDKCERLGWKAVCEGPEQCRGIEQDRSSRF